MANMIFDSVSLGIKLLFMEVLFLSHSVVLFKYNRLKYLPIWFTFPIGSYLKVLIGSTFERFLKPAFFPTKYS